MPKPSYNHFYLNPNTPFFSKIENRALFSTILRDVVRKSPSKFEEPVNTLLPRGLLPPVYHSRKESETTGHVRSKTNSSLINKLKIVLVGRHFDASFLHALQEQFAIKQLAVEINIIKGPEYNQILESKQFDMISFPVIPSFHDPDGYYSDPTYFSDCPDGKESGYKLKKHLLKIRFQANKLKRLEKYADLLDEVQKEKIIVPGFKTTIPIAISNRLVPPRTNYRDQMRLWELRLSND